MPIIHCFHLVAVDCVVSKTVSRFFIGDLMACLSNWYGRISFECVICPQMTV